MLMTWVSCFQSIRMEHTWSRSSSVSRAGALKDPVLTLLFYVRVVPPVALSLARLDLYYCSSVKAWWSAAQRGAAGPRSVTDRNRSLVSLSCSWHLDGSPHFRRPRNQFFISSKKFDSDFQDLFVKRGRLQLISVTVSFRNVFKEDDIALNYRDPEGDLIRMLDDEDVMLMIKEGRKQLGKVKRPVNQFPWELHVTLASDLSVYSTEFWETMHSGDDVAESAAAWFFLSLLFQFMLIHFTHE